MMDMGEKGGAGDVSETNIRPASPGRSHPIELERGTNEQLYRGELTPSPCPAAKSCMD